MKRTVVVKLDLDKQQRQKLDQTVQQFKKACSTATEAGWYGLKTCQKYRLQEKGTRSPHLTIQNMAGRENRYACDTLHRISKNIVKEAKEKDLPVIAFEDLKEIRDDINNDKKFQQWCFNKIYKFVEYKAEAEGIAVKQVSPKYTSQRCSECGHTTNGNRNRSKFKCLNCGKELHIDYNAAKNIGNKFLRSGQKLSGRKGYCQLALKSGLLNLNGDYTAYTA